MLQRLESIFRNTLNKWRCNIVSFSGETDHVHVLFEAHPSLNLSQLIANLKTVSSRLIRKEYSEYLAGFFWKRCAGRGVLEPNGSTTNTKTKTIKNPPSTPADASSAKERAPRQPYFWSSSYGLKSISKGAEFDVIIRYIQNQERPQPSKP